MKDFGIDIGSVHTAGNIFLAPMAGITDCVMRRLCARYGAGMVYSEMVSVNGLSYKNRNTQKLLERTPGMMCAVQLFGSDPKAFARQAASDELACFDIIDINMGCPARKITGNCEGSALMLRPELAGCIIRDASAAARVPVTVKMRAGYDDDHRNAVQIATIAQQNGAAAVTVHGRTREQGYSGTADRGIIADVVRAVDIPVIGNGDVTDERSAEAMFATGCAAIMVGRAAQGAPWIFARLNAWQRGETWHEPDIDEKKAVIMEHAQGLAQLHGEGNGIKMMRKHLCAYTRGMRGAARLRGELCGVSTVDEIEQMLRRF